MTRKPLLPIALLGLLGVLAWIPLRHAGQAAPRVAEPADAAPMMVAAHAISPMPVARALPAVTRTGSSLSPMRRGFEESNDLFAYSQALLSHAAEGDADAMWLLSLVQDYCAGYAADPAGYARDTQVIARLGLSSGGAMLSARQRVQQRCGRFVPQDGFSSPKIVTQRVQAANAGSLAAEAALLAMDQPLRDDDGYRRDLVERVLDSGDPFAFVAIAPAMGTAGNARRDTLGEVSGSELSEIAWRIASCKLGMDCSPDGSMMTNYCVNGGICSRDESQDFPTFARDAGVPRQGGDKVDDMVDTLLSHAGVDG
ncbi:hypothetical protein [Pseudoxanthomonas putridarboris]|uniref:Uncharacterized protein n=1 Tax=Pseudoxanthomonas putridarboris TaxID=752605 RepID=A0ABU9J2M1_9GAMM